MNKLYPIFLKLNNKRVLVVGGGFIALQKITSLLNTEAQITLIAPTIIDEIYACKGEFPNIRVIKFIERDYQLGDEKDFHIVIAATNIPELNMSIANRCRDQGILVNAVDEPEYCDFYVPSIVDAGEIKIAISTNGKAPSVAQKIRKDLQNIIQEKYLTLLDIIQNFRDAVHAKILGENNFSRRSKLIRWYTERVFRRLGHE